MLLCHSSTLNFPVKVFDMQSPAGSFVVGGKPGYEARYTNKPLYRGCNLQNGDIPPGSSYLKSL